MHCTKSPIRLGYILDGATALPRVTFLNGAIRGRSVHAAIPHPRLKVGKIVSPGAREAGGQIRIRLIGEGRAGKYTR